MIKLQVIGNLGKDALVNNVNGKSVINFNVAHTEKYKNKDNVEVNNTTWLSCAYWTEKTNVASYLKKGTQVFIEGKPEAKIYTNSNNMNIPQLHIRISYLQLVNSRNQEQTETESFNQ